MVPILSFAVARIFVLKFVSKSAAMCNVERTRGHAQTNPYEALK